MESTHGAPTPAVRLAAARLALPTRRKMNCRSIVAVDVEDRRWGEGGSTETLTEQTDRTSSTLRAR